MEVDSRMGTAVDDVRYRLLGPMEVCVDGAPVKLPGTAERALLAQLLLSPGRTIPATMLVDRLWSESTLPVDPMNALQIRVSKLRRALKAIGVGDVVTREGVGYRATIDPATVDALDFADRIRAARTAAANAADNGGIQPAHVQAYDDALALWRGDPLSDFAVERWAAAEAARLTELRLAAMTERAQVALALGRHQEVISDLEPRRRPRPDPGVARRVVDAGAVPQRPPSRRPRRVHPHPRGPRRVPRPRTVGVAAVPARAGPAPRRHPRRPAGHGPRPPRQLTRDRRTAVQEPAPGDRVQPAAPATVHAVAMPTHRSRADEDRTAPTNLPTVLRPLIGRDAQLDSIAELLGGVRLLSLIGAGGAGKTSLALATVVRASANYPDGAFGVRLASVTTPDQVPVAFADALGMPLDGAAATRDLRDRLISFLTQRHMLLLVDNCEHVVDAAAVLIDDILSRCPDVTVITTSREALAIPDEVQVTVGPLETPPEDSPPGEVLGYPAAQLFAERARAVRPGLVFDADNLSAIGDISRSLDGIPLALELAAARVSTLSPVEVSQRLGNRFTLLTSGARTAEERQQTLRATVDWSYQLLSETEQRVFDRLSVFQGGWTLTSAEEVVADEGALPGAVLDTVGRLVERSMVVVEPGPTTRYRMLETLRQYAAERLQASGQAVDVARRHAAYFQSVVEHAEVGLRGHEQRQTLRVLHDEQPNIRAALAFLERPRRGPRRRVDDGRLPRHVLAPRPPPRGPPGAVPAGRQPRRVTGGAGAGTASGLHRRTAPRLPGPPQPPVRRSGRREPGPVRGARRHLARRPVPSPPRRRRRHRRAPGPVAGAAGSRRGAVRPRRRPVGTRGHRVRPHGDRDQDRRRRHRGPHRPHHRRRVPSARRRLGPLRHPVPPRMGAPAVRPVRRCSPRPGGSHRRRTRRRVVEHRPVGTRRPRHREGPPR